MKVSDACVADRDRHPVGHVDRMGQGDRVARARAGDGHRSVVEADRTRKRHIGGGQRLGVTERDRQLIDAQPGQVGVPARRQQSQSVGRGLERGGLAPPADSRPGDAGLELVGTDIDDPVDDARESGAALVGRQGLTGGGIHGQGVAPGVDGGAAGQEGDGLGGPAVESQRAEARVGDADQVAVGAVGQAAGAARADQVVGAGGGDHADDVAAGVLGDDRVVQGGRAGVDIEPPPALSARVELTTVRLVGVEDPPPVPAELSARVELTTVNVPPLKIPPPWAAPSTPPTPGLPSAPPM